MAVHTFRFTAFLVAAGEQEEFSLDIRPQLQIA
jgi:hypothetical protein